jgi:RNA polymerase sigma-70 factor (ECF subfamily)
MLTPSDAELIEQMRANNRQAFAALYERYKISIFRYCVRMLGDESSAEDATHDTFLKLFSHAGSLQSPQALHGWLLSTARNEVMMMFRRQKRTEPYTDEDILTDQTPHDLTVIAETREIVQLLLRQLKAEYREVLVLREYDRLSYSEIALITGDTESSVKSRLFKARKVLADKLKLYYT